MNLSSNYGKEFEAKLSSLVSTQESEVILYRIKDQMSGRKGSKNPCDFIMYSYPNQFWIECKSTVNTSWSLAELDPYQLKSLQDYSQKKGSCSFVLLLFVCEPSVFAIPIDTITRLIEMEIGTININKLRKGKYEGKFYELPLKETKTYLPDFKPEALKIFTDLAELPTL